MTNREWLNSLSNVDFVRFIFADRSFYETIDKDGKATKIILCEPSPVLKEVVDNYNSASARFLQWLDENR